MISAGAAKRFSDEWNMAAWVRLRQLAIYEARFRRLNRYKNKHDGSEFSLSKCQ
jgi:hypothetical protein